MSDRIDNVFTAISGYAVSGKATDEAYCQLRDTAADVYSLATNPADAASDFATLCRLSEDEFMEANYITEPAARHTKGKRNGQWKYRTYLPAAYSSAKTELHKAMMAGIDPAGLGKTELAKRRTTKTSTSTTPEERIAKACTTITNALNEMTVSDADDARQHIAMVLGL